MLDLVGVDQLVKALVPSWAAGRGISHYFMALFDLDGDSWVGGPGWRGCCCLHNGWLRTEQAGQKTGWVLLMFSQYMLLVGPQSLGLDSASFAAGFRMGTCKQGLAQPYIGLSLMVSLMIYSNCSRDFGFRLCFSWLEDEIYV